MGMNRRLVTAVVFSSAAGHGKVRRRSVFFFVCRGLQLPHTKKKKKKKKTKKTKK
jgi:hypothetical protein